MVAVGNPGRATEFRHRRQKNLLRRTDLLHRPEGNLSGIYQC